MKGFCLKCLCLETNVKDLKPEFQNAGPFSNLVPTTGCRQPVNNIQGCRQLLMVPNTSLARSRCQPDTHCLAVVLQNSFLTVSSYSLHNSVLSRLKNTKTGNSGLHLWRWGAACGAIGCHAVVQEGKPSVQSFHHLPWQAPFFQPTAELLQTAPSPCEHILQRAALPPLTEHLHIQK